MNHDDRMSPRQAADFMGLSQSTLSLWRADGVGPRYSRIGPARVFYNKADLETFCSRTFMSASEEAAASAERLAKAA